jgi:hypothetical protein
MKDALILPLSTFLLSYVTAERSGFDVQRKANYREQPLYWRMVSSGLLRRENLKSYKTLYCLPIDSKVPLQSTESVFRAPLLSAASW